MINMLMAYTREIDDKDIAVAEILEQLDIENKLLKNSVGILTCYSEFVDSGVVKAISAALPFDVVGCTTLGNGTAGQSGTMMLCLSVLTSDEVSFATAKSKSLAQNTEQAIKDMYEQAVPASAAKPSLILSFTPLLLHVGGEFIVENLHAVTQGIPVFGTLACDYTHEYTSSYTFFNGEADKEALSIILVYGDIDPRFFVVSISEEKIRNQKAIITSSEGSVLREVNGLPLVKYMQTIGLTRGDGIEGAGAIPFVVDYNDGTQPVARAIYLVTPEGYAVCGGAMPVNSTLGIGSMDSTDVLKTSEEITREVMATSKKNGLLVFSCLSRNLVLGTDVLAEMDKVSDVLGGSVPYHICYAGGEICPVYNEADEPVNRFHNFTFIACVF